MVKLVYNVHVALFCKNPFCIEFQLILEMIVFEMVKNSNKRISYMLLLRIIQVSKHLKLKIVRS